MSQPKEFQSNMRFGSSRFVPHGIAQSGCALSQAPRKVSQHNGGLSLSVDKVGAKSGDTLRVRRRGPSMPTAGKCEHGRAPTTSDSSVAVSLCCVKHGHEKRRGAPKACWAQRFPLAGGLTNQKVSGKHILTLTLLYQQPPRPNNNFETRTWMDTCPACYP